MTDTVYIAGPMRGLPHFNFPAFDDAALKFERLGFNVINPAQIDRDHDGDVDTLTVAQADARVRTYAKRDTEALLGCTHIALLPGWESSKGATAEYHFAKWIGLTILDATTAEPLAASRARPALPALLTTDKQARKEQPIARGVLDYFPNAIAEVARLSYIGNQQHNPGQPMHWAREKSTDHADCIARHLIERGRIDDDGQRHSTKAAWRALALLQLELEAANAANN